jgi:hypothetical protein
VIVVFEQAWELDADAAKRKHYYVRESVRIAVGLLLAALHNAGLATLTHAPSPMGFLKEILGRPTNNGPSCCSRRLPADDARCRGAAAGEEGARGDRRVHRAADLLVLKLLCPTRARLPQEFGRLVSQSD